MYPANGMPLKKVLKTPWYYGVAYPNYVGLLWHMQKKKKWRTVRSVTMVGYHGNGAVKYQTAGQAIFPILEHPSLVWDLSIQ